MTVSTPTTDLSFLTEDDQADLAYAATVADAEQDERDRAAKAHQTHRTPVYGLYPVEWQDGAAHVADKPAAEVAPLSPVAVFRVANLLAGFNRRDLLEHRVSEIDLLLYGHAYHDPAGRRIDPATVTTRLAPDGTADGFLVADPEGRAQLRRDLTAAFNKEAPRG